MTAAARGRALRVETLEARHLLSGTGLWGQYFHNTDFTGLAAERVEAVNFGWGTTAPAPGVAPDTYSVRWLGQVQPQFSETYTFRTISDDGVRLWVNGQLLIDDWNSGSARSNTGTIPLTAGQSYDLRLEYFEDTGLSQMRLQWSSPSQALNAIPASRLYAPPPGVRGAYADSVGGAATRIDATLNFNWQTAAPIPGVASDDFRVTWTGLVRADFSDVYSFQTLSDEGVRVWIGGELVVDHWDPHGLSTQIGAKSLEAGKWYDLRVEYYDTTGAAAVTLNWSSPQQTGVGVWQSIPNSSLRATSLAPLYFTNPLGLGQDPFVIRWNNTYLLVRSSANSIWIDQADRLEELHESHPNSRTVRAWTAPPGSAYDALIWAPEIAFLDGKWYIYFAASDGPLENQRMHVLERDSADPMGSFNYKSTLTSSPDRWAIDGTVLEWANQRYFVWSGWPGFSNAQQNLYIAEMANPWTLVGSRQLLSTPSQAWEMHGLSINEGPQILIDNGQLHIIYSGSAYWEHEYALGRLTYNGVGSLLSAASWTKIATPVFQQAGDVVGVGHASFTTSPDGSEHWIVYHAHRDANNWQDDRVVQIQPFTFTAAGLPQFGAPLARSTKIPLPSGYAQPNRPLLAGDYNADGVVDAADLTVFQQQFNLLVFPGSGADGGGNGVVDAADFTRWRDNLGASATSGAIAVQPTSAGALPAATSSEPMPKDRLLVVTPSLANELTNRRRPDASRDEAFAAWGTSGARRRSDWRPALVETTPALRDTPPMTSSPSTSAAEANEGHGASATLERAGRRLRSWYGKGER